MPELFLFPDNLNKVITAHNKLFISIYTEITYVSLDIVDHVDIKIFSTNPQVRLLVNEDFQRVKARHENPLTNVKLLPIEKVRLFYVFLDDLRAHLFFVLIPIESIAYIVKAVNTDAPSVITWFTDPNVATTVDCLVLNRRFFHKFVDFETLIHNEKVRDFPPSHSSDQR